ncbi:DNA-binding HxlR family transcriptional regulator [Allocatelliglobosispora scoriae]|uniref:DNA-binding HxlR family transcriptional regulator n=1 Tax=Allocatelliglobosispora scoriae TaxID=643052 RepID=A0A841BT73_9ACTN|nr:helix-turn-helix domain-containing protein [Allocatelliglobosispora scoriae]MBB5870001.1 DNA-binding HxlR family transcriptional regulator [Allocatelliglobosispora scoriae]
MSIRTYGQDCSVARSLEIVGERWTILIIRNALLGECRFDTFLNNLGLARNILTERLNTLVESGIFERVPYQQRPLRHEYKLTPKGQEFGSVVLSLMQWGDKYLAGKAGPPRTTEHVNCGGSTEVHVMCTKCGESVHPGDVITHLVTPPPITRAVRVATRTRQPATRTRRRSP